MPTYRYEHVPAPTSGRNAEGYCLAHDEFNEGCQDCVRRSLARRGTKDTPPKPAPSAGCPDHEAYHGNCQECLWAKYAPRAPGQRAYPAPPPKPEPQGIERWLPLEVQGTPLARRLSESVVKGKITLDQAYHAATPDLFLTKAEPPKPPTDWGRVCERLWQAIALPLAIELAREQWRRATRGRGTLSWDLENVLMRDRRVVAVFRSGSFRHKGHLSALDDTDEMARSTGLAIEFYQKALSFRP